MCPTPDKITFRSLRAAAQFGLEQLTAHGHLLRPYRCDCGDYHLTSHGLDGNVLTEAMVRAVAAAVA